MINSYSLYHVGSGKGYYYNLFRDIKVFIYISEYAIIKLIAAKYKRFRNSSRTEAIKAAGERHSITVSGHSRTAVKATGERHSIIVS